jgi:hypothetical protein
MNLETLGTGVPPPWKLGAAKSELLAMLVAMAVVALIFAAFWLEARP